MEDGQEVVDQEVQEGTADFGVTLVACRALAKCLVHQWQEVDEEGKCLGRAQTEVACVVLQKN